jgi:hypothetical protein
MDVDDEDDKIRRNLVVVSGGVLLGFIAGLPEGALIERVLGAKDALNPARFWLAVLLVVLYLSYRYRFSRDWGNGWSRFNSEREDRAQWSIQSSVHVAVARFCRGQRPSIKFAPALDSLRRELADAHASRSEVDFAGSWKTYDATGGSGSTIVSVKWLVDGSTVQSRTVEFEYQLTKWQLSRHRILAFGRTVLFSEPTAAHLMPVLFSVLAIGVVIWRIWRVTQG